MFLPLHDDTPLKVIRFQFVTLAIIVLNVLIFLYIGPFGGDAIMARVEAWFGLVPVELLNVQTGHAAVPEPVTLITYLFLHASWMHLIGNMLFMWVLADNIEDSFGNLGFLFFYLLCGVVGGLIHVFMMPGSPSPLIGASGSVSGIIAAYLVLYPRARIWVLAFLAIPIPLPAIVVLGGWFLLQIFSVFAAKEGQDIAWWAHIGGFLCGLMLTLGLRSWLLGQPNGRI